MAYYGCTLTGTIPLSILDNEEAIAFILQAVDWVARKIGYDLIGAIMDPIAGDFSAVDGMRMDWQSISHGLDTIGGNYDSTVATDYKHCGCRYEDPVQEVQAHESYAWTRAHSTPETRRYRGAL